MRLGALQLNEYMPNAIQKLDFLQAFSIEFFNRAAQHEKGNHSNLNFDFLDTL